MSLLIWVPNRLEQAKSKNVNRLCRRQGQIDRHIHAVQPANPAIGERQFHQAAASFQRTTRRSDGSSATPFIRRPLAALTLPRQ